MRRAHIGAFPDTFEERLRDGRCRPGEIGQYVNTAHQFTSIGDSRRGDRFGWPIDHLASQCVFDWAPGDGNTPYIGPTLDIVDGGGPDETDVSPWVGRDGAALKSAYFDGTEARRTATALTPTAGQDVRVVALVYAPNDRISGKNMIFSTRVLGPGVQLWERQDIGRFAWRVENDTVSLQRNADGYFGWCLIDCYWDLSGNSSIHVNTILGQSGAPGAGAHAAWDGVGVGADPDGANPFEGRIARVLAWFGDNVSNAADMDDIVRGVFGLTDTQQNGAATITRATSAVMLRDTHYHVVAVGSPRSGGQEGILIEPTSINKVYNQVNPQNTNGWTVTGGAMAAVDDTVALRTAGLLEWGPYVHEFIPGGAPAIMYGGAQTGNVNAHSISVWIRGAAGGESVDVGVRDVSSGAMQNVQTVVCTTGYQKVTLHGFVPGDTDRQFALDCDAGDTIYHIGAHMEESPRCTSPIPNWSAVATVQRNLDDIILAETPADEGGSIEVTVEPVGWSGVEWGGANFLFRTGAGGGLLYVDGAGHWVAIPDGTTTLDSGIQPVDGTPYRIRLRWRVGGNQSIEIWDMTPQLLARVESAYDGTLTGPGTWEFAAGAPMLVSNFIAYRGCGG